MKGVQVRIEGETVFAGDLRIGRADEILDIVESNAANRDEARRKLQKVKLNQHDMDALRDKNPDDAGEETEDGETRKWSSREAFFSGMANYCIREGYYSVK